ncbi:hypothetical protein GGR53DRAFT_492640 [Hypoxylon sp. FL1150]|nr:hypothetical protein GGR53DRAFT_492640 [Hypoxylon sp. FL1150]
MASWACLSSTNFVRWLLGTGQMRCLQWRRWSPLILSALGALATLIPSLVSYPSYPLTICQTGSCAVMDGSLPASPGVPVRPLQSESNLLGPSYRLD